jgi:hypothetical protein
MNLEPVLNMEEKTLQSVPVMPFALMLACVSAGIGFIIGIVYAVIFSAIFASIPTLTTSTINLGWLSVLIGAGAIIIFPILYFIGGLIFGAIGASLYNFLAPRIGGIKLRFKEEYRPTQP